MRTKSFRACALALAASLSGVLLPTCTPSHSPPAGGGPADTSQILPTVGLLSVAAGELSPAAGDGRVQARWDARELDATGVSVALFLATDPALVYQGAPVHAATTLGAIVLEGLDEDQPVWLGLAADLGGGQYEPLGALMSATPGVVVYVDVASNAIAPDGTSPATAFASLADGLLAAEASAQAGHAANVWVAGGVYDDVAVTIPPGVHVYGSFEPTFDLQLRNPLQAGHRSLLRALHGQAVVTLAGGAPGAILDGFELDGQGASAGIEVVDTPARLSALDLSDCGGPGMRLDAAATSTIVPVTVARCNVVRCDEAGLQLAGRFQLRIEDSRFSVNAAAGVALDELVGSDGLDARLSMRDSVCFGNGAEGLACALGAPPAPGAGGSYDVLVEGSRFERNGWKGATPASGLRLELGFAGSPGWSANVLVRGSIARANLGAGLDLGLDAPASACVHRVLASANGLDGLLVRSSQTPGLALVSTSVLSDNLGAGVRATTTGSEGDVAVVLAHSILAGNALAGLASEQVESAAVSSAAWLQAEPFGGAAGVRQRGDVVGDDAGVPLFERAPLAYREVLFFNGFALALDDTSNLVIGDLVELADDSTPRYVVSFTSPTEVVVDGIPTSLDVPASFTRFEAGGDVLEDYGLPAGSAALGAGMPPPSGPAPDAGVFGAPLGGAPGDEGPLRPPLFRVAGTTPATSTPLAPGDDVAIAFAGGDLDALSIAGNVQVRDDAGGVVAVPPPALVGGALVVSPPGGGWPSGALTLELFDGLETVDTPPVGLAVPVALPFTVQ